MKRILIAAVAFACFAISIVAGFRAVQKPPRPPGFAAEPEIVKLGERATGETVRGGVRFRNTFPHAIQIVEWSSTCSCAGLSVSEREVPSGGETTLQYEWHIGSQPGPTQQALSVLYHYGDGKLDLANVYLRCAVAGEMICEPRQIEFEAGRASTATVRFCPGRLKTFAFDAAWGPSTAFTAKANGDVLTIDYNPAGRSDKTPGAGLVAQLNGVAESSIAIPLLVRTAVPKAMPKAVP